jgi:RNA polymerase sigma factor (sigma-70 family)
VPDPHYASIVKRAQTGDPSAFTELVIEFQDLAVGTAYSWLGEIEAARDVAQEAFLDTHRLLDQLRDPQAFPGWFQQIVTKHCDRATRGQRIETAPLDLANQLKSPAPGPDTLLAEDQRRDQLRLAVESLPQGERVVIALHYFAQATHPEVSAFLELPESTVKKRLRRARRRLRDEGDKLMQETISDMRPSGTDSFALAVSFFIALRSGDQAEVKRLIDMDPSLVDTLQDWDSSLAYQGILPFANKATPLITAIERNDLPMQQLLLDAGADVDGTCGCATGEAPIWAATLLNRPAHARKLLERGADPNVTSASGNRPLHLAAMRGLKELVVLLLKHGADPTATDAGTRRSATWSPADGNSPHNPGRTAAQWALANGHRELATLIDTTSGEQTERSISAGSSTDQSTNSGSMIATGIKAVDLFAPLLSGGIVRIPFVAGVGMVVLLGELCQRFLAMDSGAAIWTGFTQRPFDLADWEADMSEFGLKDQIHGSLAGFDEAPQARRVAFDAGLQKAESLRNDGKDVLAVVLSAAGFENDVEASLLRLKAPAETGSITSIIVTPFPENRDLWTELKPPYSGQIALDRRRATQHLFPAIDPHYSLSEALQSSIVGGRHVDLANRALQLLTAYQKVDPEFTKLGAETGKSATPVTESAPRLLRYLSQPFSTTEPFTGRPGEHVAVTDLLQHVEEILNSCKA